MNTSNDLVASAVGQSVGAAPVAAHGRRRPAEGGPSFEQVVDRASGPNRGSFAGTASARGPQHWSPVRARMRPANAQDQGAGQSNAAEGGTQVGGPCREARSEQGGGRSADLETPSSAVQTGEVTRDTGSIKPLPDGLQDLSGPLAAEAASWDWTRLMQNALASTGADTSSDAAGAAGAIEQRPGSTGDAASHGDGQNAALQPVVARISATLAAARSALSPGTGRPHGRLDGRRARNCGFGWRSCRQLRRTGDRHRHSWFCGGHDGAHW